MNPILDGLIIAWLICGLIAVEELYRTDSFYDEEWGLQIFGWIVMLAMGPFGLYLTLRDEIKERSDAG